MTYITDKLTLKITGVIFAILIVFCTYATLAQVQTSGANAAQGMEISPAIIELNGAKGGTYNLSIKVTNVTPSDLVYETSVEDFRAKDETGSPQVLIGSDLPDTISVKSWVSTIPSFSLESRKSETVTFTVSIPVDAEVGGHYGVLRFAGNAPELDSTGVALSASAGALLLVRVDGAIAEEAELASFYTGNSGKQTSFLENAPVDFTVRIKNTGNIHTKPTGAIEIKDMFSNTVVNLAVNENLANVLPDSIRKFETTYDGWMFGYYTANLALGYGTSGQAIVGSTSFWVIPYRAILVGLLLLVTALFVVIKLIKAYNRRIIAKSKNEIQSRRQKKKGS